MTAKLSRSRGWHRITGIAIPVPPAWRKKKSAACVRSPAGGRAGRNLNGNPSAAVRSRNSARFEPYQETIESNEPQPFDQRVRRFASGQFQKIETGGRDGTSAVRESNQRNDVASAPTLRCNPPSDAPARGRTESNRRFRRDESAAVASGLLQAPAGFKQRAIQVLDAEMNRLGGLQVVILYLEAHGHHAIHRGVRRRSCP